MAPIARYTRIVALIKRSLWLLIALMIGVVIWIATFNADMGGARIALNVTQKSEQLIQPSMQHPHYQGVDAKNRPYTVLADKATQIDADNVELTAIQADMTDEKGKWLALKAGQGKMHLPTKQLTLFSGVDIFYDGGYEFRTDHALVDIKNSAAYGDAPIEGQGPLGTLKAKSFSIENRGAVIRFNDSVIMKLYH